MEGFRGTLTIDGRGTFPVEGSMARYPRPSGTMSITDEALLDVLDSGMSCRLEMAGARPMIIVIGGMGRNASSTGHPPWAAFEAAAGLEHSRGPRGAVSS